MTTLDLDALEALCNAATPGPWGLTTDLQAVLQLNDRGGGLYIVECVQKDEQPNAAFIAASRAALPALIAECRRLQSESRE
jgi:hypothetical protein